MSDRETTGDPEQEPFSSESDLGSFVPGAIEPPEETVKFEAKEKPEPVTVPEPEQHRVFAGTGISWAFIFGVLLTVAIIVLAVQNTETVPVQLYFWETTAPLIIVILVGALAAVLIDELIGMIIRRRKRKVLAEREELKHLRAKADSRDPRIE
ncbi:MAG: lipopolysaccharide assembly protein LapA domain-containing protein [Acidimicrobiia bacterium]|nr:lipopolysaccharide assembly protein LapA domain-containing protein [Acidimicrobiia bacterium]MDH3398311.1 lipopolysaccharide assembly protein LapA domain-containing protein [Acidimicrobiia bacterium]